ncbi:MAG: hypothetical protein LUD48_06220, partial [Prevotella sp.]|nr:hypothetical protein [Prevotella sp.]
NKQLFVYSKDNDTYLSDYFSMSIGTKSSVRKEIDRTCDKEEKDELYKQLDEYKDEDIVTLNKNKNGSHIILPIAAAFIAKDLVNKINQAQMQRQLRKEDKYRAGSIEAQYDNYLSPMEQVTMFEKYTRNHSTKSKGIDFEK